jgi:hypothetical protein
MCAVTNEQAREELRCRGCGHLKSTLGMVVCWECFKGRNGRPAFKYYTDTLAQWLRDYPPRCVYPDYR